ncbi:(Fe-S)-binding protein [Oscillatoriales cyanobacterium USR001]|nr:(Fe-S)-binding protein [Oscillatoriales cyanobacterium USR001]
MCKSRKEVSEFSLKGQILGFLFEDGYKLKYLQIVTFSGEEYTVKIAKELRSSLTPVLVKGLAVLVIGEKKFSPESGEIKLKAYSVIPVAMGNLPESDREVTTSFTEPVSPTQINSTHTQTAITIPTNYPQAKTKILVCQKSDCQKRGGRAIGKALEAALSDRGLTDQVTIQGTGCLKQCKAGPNIVLMPDKTRYSRIEPTEIAAIIEKHFAKC